VVALHGGRAAGTPLAGEVEVVGAFATDMAFADMVLYGRVLSARCYSARVMRLGVDFTSSLHLHRVIPVCPFARRSLATGMSGCRRCLMVSLMGVAPVATAVVLLVALRSLLAQLALQSGAFARP